MVNVELLKELLLSRMREEELKNKMNLQKFQEYDEQEGGDDFSYYKWFENSSDPEGDKRALECIKSDARKFAYDQIYMLLNRIKED